MRNPRRKVIPPPAEAPALQGATRGDAWLASRGSTLFAFQREVWAAMAEGKSVERFREELSTEKLADRLTRILKEANAEIDAAAAAEGLSQRRARAPRRKIDA